MLWYHLSLCTQSSHAGGGSRHLFHTWRELEGPYVVWSFPGGRAEHECAGAFSLSISAVEVSLGHEGEVQ